MNNLILDGYATDELNAALNDPHLSLLVREINHKYKLVAYRKAENSDSKVHMCDANGLNACSLAVTVENSEPTFHYHSPWYEKDRGNSTQDRQTLRSKKLSALMATLKRHDVVPKSEFLVEQIVAKPIISTVYSQIRWAYRYDDPRPLEAQIGRTLLKIMFGEEPEAAYSTLDREYCRMILDKYNDIEQIVQTVKDTQQRIMHEPFYAIGANAGEQYIIGKAKVETDKAEGLRMTVIEPFKRVKSVMEIEELRGFLTMLKVTHDKMAESGRRMLGGEFKIPYTDHYDKDMEVVYGYNNVDRYNRQWMVFPCSAV